MKKKLLIYIILLLASGTGVFGQLTIDSTKVDSVTCFGYTDGAITAYVSGGSNKGFIYRLFDDPFIYQYGSSDSTFTFTNLRPNTVYYFQVIDSSDFSNRDFSDNIIIGSPEKVTVTSSSTTDINCATVIDGTIDVDASGEHGNLRYYLSGPVTDDNLSGDFNSLPAGTYKVVVKDDDGCPSKDSAMNLVIDIPPLLEVSAAPPQDATCFGGNDGAIDITASGGTPRASAPEYDYSWSGTGPVEINDEDQSTLIAGSYNVIVTDDNGCTATFPSDIVVGEAAEITMTIASKSNVSCNGENDGEVQINVSNGTPPLNFLWKGDDPAHTSTARDPDDLYPDVYDLTITDADGCEAIFLDTVTITEPDLIAITIDSAIEPLCFGDANGSAAITVSGGSESYVRIEWTAGPVTRFGSNPTTLPAGLYTIEIEDSNGCIKIFTDTLNLGQPDALDATLLGFSDALCFGSSTGTAQVLVEYGTPAYNYLWTGDFTGHTTTMSNPDTLKADTYDLQIIDNNGCDTTFNDIVTIGQPEDITTGISVTDVLCNGALTGSIEITPDKGTPPYTFAWSGTGVIPGDQNQYNLAAGFYDVRVTDVNGCFKDYNIEVQENSLIDTALFRTHLTCFESADGSIDLTISGGVSPYNTRWESDLGYLNLIDQDISGLDAATYTLTITDDESCQAVFNNIVITQPQALATVFTPTDARCFESDDGKIDIDISGGTAPYQTDWYDPGFVSSDEDIDGLAPGTYTLYLRDAKGCDTTYTDEVVISQPDDITISSSHTDITCAGEGDGTISATASNGTPGYTYEWISPGYSGSGPSITGLEAGVYDLKVIDSHNCEKEFFNVANILEPDSIKVSFDSQVDLDCFGDSNGSIQITRTGGIDPISYLWTRSGGAFVSSFEDPTGLTADVYSLQVSDVNGCSVTYTDTIEITQPPEVQITLNKTDVDCYGDTTGTITVTSSGGIGTPYEYRILGSPYQPDNVFDSLMAGTYTVFTKDGNDCEASDDITIDEPGQITYSDYGVSGSNKCNGDADATIYINTVNGGVPPYQYTIDGGFNWQFENSFPDLPGGSYDVRVKDSESCERTINDDLKVDEPFPIIITYLDTTTVNTCYDDPIGEIEILSTGGSGSRRYSIDNGATFQASGLFIDLLGGTYNVQIVDDSLCTKDTIVEILRPSKVVFNQADTTGVTGCHGDSNGRLEVNAIGGTGPKQYSLDSINYQVPNLFTGLWASDTTVYAIDAKGCRTDTTVTITQPAPILLITETATDADCNGASTGTVTVKASGGTLPYLYTLTPAVFPANDSGVFINLPADSYSVDVTDAGGCGPIPSIPLVVDEPTALQLDSVRTDFISCNGANDAEIHVFVSEGTPPYQYSYNGEATYISASSQTTLGQGTYDVFVMDANGCTLPVGSYTFDNPPNISLNASLTHVSPCFGGTNGAIDAAATGGWESFEYSLNGVDYQASGIFTGLPAGDTTIFTRDTGNCISTLNVTITEPEEITATITKTDYVDDVLGTITIADAAGGVPPYLYAINGTSGDFSTATYYDSLVAGMYDVVVQDDSGCYDLEQIRIYDIVPLLMVIDSADVSCFGAGDGFIEFLPQDAVGEVQYSIDDGATFSTTARYENLVGDSMYILRAYDEDGKVYWDSVFIAEPAEIDVTVTDLTPANCNVFSETGGVDISVAGGTGSYTYVWSNGATSEDLVDVVAGDYSVVVTDNSDCSESEDISISADWIVNADAGKDTTICQGESIILNAKGGDIVLWEPATYLSNQSISDPVANNVQETITYRYTETETVSTHGCYDIDSLTITVLPTFGIEATQDTVALVGQQVQLEATGGPFETYSWIPTSNLDDSNIANPVATAEVSITYVIQATNEYGCVESDSVHIEVIENITVYNSFSPNNGDDINQYFEIDNADQFPQMLVEVYNRWGSRVFSSVGYTDDKRWDGTARGKDVPIGTYYYIVIPYPDATPITGNVTIIR